MTSRSKFSLAFGVSLALMLVGCSNDVGTANAEKVDVQAAAQKQAGQGGRKAAMGGGVDEGVVPAPAGVKTGAMTGGGK